MFPVNSAQKKVDGGEEGGPFPLRNAEEKNDLNP